MTKTFKYLQVIFSLIVDTSFHHKYVNISDLYTPQ